MKIRNLYKNHMICHPHQLLKAQSINITFLATPTQNPLHQNKSIEPLSFDIEMFKTLNNTKHIYLAWPWPTVWVLDGKV